MKKLTAIILIGILSVSMLAGCGRKEKEPEEEKAREEIRQHLVDEAAAEGIDLQAEFEKEAEETYAEMEARDREREAKQDTREELDAYYDPLLQAEYDALIAAASAEDTIRHGSRYNELIRERDARGEEAGIVWGTKGCYIGLDAAYISKAMFLTGQQYGTFDEYEVRVGHASAATSPEDELMLIYSNLNESGNISELVFVKKDLTVSRIDVSQFFAPDICVTVETAGTSFVELCAIENADWNFYLFDITSPDGILTAKSTDFDDFEEYRSEADSFIPAEDRLGTASDYEPLWGVSPEDLNDMIVRQTLGAAADAYR